MNFKKAVLFFGLAFQLIKAQVSPEIADFVNYGNRPVSKYTERLEKDIPLCNINQYGFNINLSLHYSARALRPLEVKSRFGANWFLNSGGSITRTVVGVEDDRDDRRAASDKFGRFHYRSGDVVYDYHTYRNFSGISFPKPRPGFLNKDGFYVGIQKYIPPTVEDIKNNTSSIVKTFSAAYIPIDEDRYNVYVGPKTDPYELSMDTFLFNFGNGISGKFYIGPDGLAKVTPNGPYNLDIDITGFSPQVINADGTHNIDKPTISEIVITTDNGYKYYFGGTYDALDWYYSRLYMDTSNTEFFPVISTWNLKKIVSPKGYQVKYKYQLESITEKGLKETVSDSWHKDFSFKKNGVTAQLNRFSKNYSELYRVGVGFRNECKGTNVIEPSFSFLKTSLLKEIWVEDIVVKIQKNKITVDGKGKIPDKKIDLLYRSFEIGNFLETIKINNEEPYVFKYGDLEKLNKFGPRDVNEKGDLYIGQLSAKNGFGSGVELRFSKEVNIPIDFAATATSAQLYNYRRKRADLYSCYYVKGGGGYNFLTSSRPLAKDELYGGNSGILQKIIYPTKGSEAYFYKDEKQFLVDKIRYRSGTNNNDFYDVSFSNVKGDRSKVGFLLSKDINPTTIYTPLELRSEQLEQGNIKYTFYSKKEVPYKEGKIKSEIIVTASGKPLSKVEYFYDLDINPFDKNTPEGKAHILNRVQFLEKATKIRTTNELAQKGVVIGKIYPIINNLRRKKTYLYDKNTTITLDEIRKKYTPFGVNDQDKKAFYAKIQADPSVRLVEDTEYEYDSEYFKLIKTKITYADGSIRYTENKYPFNYVTVATPSSSILKIMMDRNQIIPVKSYTYFSPKNSATLYLSGINTTEYQLHNNVIVPKKQYSWSPSANTLEVFDPTNFNKLTVDHMGQVTVNDILDTSYVEYLDYNSQNIPTRTYSSDGKVSVSIIDTPYTRPIVTFSNITREQLESVPVPIDADPLVAEIIAHENFSNYYQFVEETVKTNSLVARALSGPIDDPLFLRIKEHTENYFFNYIKTAFPQVRFSCNHYNKKGLLDYQLDTNNNKISFEYDNNNRLIITRDHQGDIISYNQYNTKK